MIGRQALDRRTFLRVSFGLGSLLVVVGLEACSEDDTNGPTTAPISTTAPPSTRASTTIAAPITTQVARSGVAPTQPDPTATPSSSTPFAANLFVRVDVDNTVTLTVHRTEMGQGVRTSLAMVLAEELGIDWTDVHVEQADAGDGMGSMTTSGSGTMVDNYDRLRAAGASARATFVAAFAQRFGIDPTACSVEHGTVVQIGTPNRLTYGELVDTARELEAPTSAKVLDPARFTLIGTSPPRIDGPDIVRGAAVYGNDIRRPGMRFAAIARSPVPGGTLQSFDAAAASATPGVTGVVQITNGVAVVAGDSWSAMRGRDAVVLAWDDGANAAMSSPAILAVLAAQARAAVPDEPAATPTPTLTSALTFLEAEYSTPYLAHAAMEPLSCTAEVRSDGCEIWASTQNPQGIQEHVTEALGVPTTVHVTLAGGGFGRRLEVDIALEAAEVSKAIGGPVQVVWSREDDIRHDFYRQPTAHFLRAGYDANGTVKVWRQGVAAPGLNGIAYRAGLEVVQEGSEVSYSIPDRKPHVVLADVPLPTGPWRAVMNGPHTFAHECFLDEIAHALGRDPYQLRLDLLGESAQLRSVFQLAATAAGWGSPLPDGHGVGIAGATIYGQTSVAMVAEASVTDRVVRVHHVVCAIDCGFVVNPDMVVQQMEGGIAFGLTSLLKGQITFEGGRVVEGNFTDYPLLQLSEMPVVEVHIVPSERKPQGVGEMGVPAIVPAVANAIFACTGVRIRRTPIRPEDLG